MKKLLALTSALIVVAGIFSGCGQVNQLGSKAPDIAIDRGEYIQQKNASMKVQDITSVTSFLDTLAGVIGKDMLENCELSYDPQTQTVYATTADANIAFRLDENGDIMLACANGAPETKAMLSQGIAKVYIGMGKAGSVDALWNKIDEARWLNDINSAVIVKAAEEFQLSELDITLPSASLPAAYLKAPSTELDYPEMPTITNSLQNKGIKDLTNYYESPSLPKFWKDADMSDIEDEIAEINKKGTSMKNSYANISLDKPNQDVPKWSLDDYTLPSKFADGSSTNLGKETKAAFDSFQTSLEGWRDELWQKELDAQEQGNQAMQEANAQGNQRGENGLNKANSSVQGAQSQNQSSVQTQSGKAAENAGLFQDKTESDVNEAIEAGKQDSQKTHQQDVENANQKFQSFLELQK